MAVCGLTTWLLSALAAGPDPALPWADGYGRNARGGTGGGRIAVTSFADSGPGTLRAAVTASGPRTVVFEVAGIVTLGAPLVVQEPYLTLDGSSAPGDGVCIRGSEVSIRAHDVLIDHVSATWAVDEDLSPSGAIRDVTVSWSIIAEGLDHSVHSKGAHGYGSLVRAIGGVTLHHNLWAHNASRNPATTMARRRGRPSTCGTTSSTTTAESRAG